MLLIKRTEQIITFAKAHGMKTIATHINGISTFQKAKDLGIDLFQGFYLQLPTQDPSHTLKVAL